MCLQLPRFPLELQCEILLWLKDECDVHRYALVAKHFYMWLQPFLYRNVRLRNDDVARAFVDHQLMKPPPANVEELDLGPLINVTIIADVLGLCPKITSLTIRSSYQQLEDEEMSSLLDPLEDLRSLRSLHIGLMTDKPGVFYLPNYPVFHRLTHLHLGAAAITLSMIPLGLSRLSNLTHLSLHWYTSRSCTSGLQGFLARHSSRVLVLWHSDISSYSMLADSLGGRNLADRRVVLLRCSRYTEYMANGGFWSYAEQVVAWRTRTNAHPLEVSTEMGTSDQWNA